MPNNFNQKIFDNDLLNGLPAASVENDPIGAPVGIASAVSAASAEADPIGVGIGLSAGDSGASAEANPFGAVVALPAGQLLAVTEHDPEGDDIAFTFGQSATATEHDGIGAPYGISAGVAAVSSESNPLGVPAGVVGGDASSTQAGDPSGAPTGIASGLNAVASENDPTADNGAGTNGTALPDGLSLVAAAIDPVVELSSGLGGGIAWPYQPLAARHWSAPLSTKPPKIVNVKPIVVSGTAIPKGVAAQIKLGKIDASGGGNARTVQAKPKPIARVGKIILHGDGNVTLRALRMNIAEVGEPRGKGIINPTDEEIAMLIGMCA